MTNGWEMKQMRPIDADKVYNQYIEQMKELVNSTTCENVSLEALSVLCGAKLLTDAPTVEPKRGRWIEDDYIIICSECREPAIHRDLYSLTNHTTNIKMIKTPYCPHCGAAMTEGSETDE